MSVFDIPTSTTNKIFNEYIKPGLNTEFVSNTILYDRFKTAPETCLGEYGVLKLQTAGSKSARPSSSSEYPEATQGTYDEFLFYMKRAMYASLQFDGLAIACGKGAGAVKDIVKAETEGQALYIASRLNRQFWGDGSGRLAQLDAGSTASTTVNIDSPLFGKDSSSYTVAHQYLEEGMSVDIYNNTATTLEAEDVAISTLTDDADGTSTIVMGSAVTASDDSWIFQHDTYATTEAAGTGVPMGLHGIITTANPYVGVTATSAFQNIDRSSNTFAQAQSFQMGASATVATQKRILEVIHKAERKGGTIDVIITTHPVYLALFDILAADRTLPGAKALWGGTSGIDFIGGRKKTIPIIWDDDCPDNNMYFLDSSKIIVSAPTKSGMEWQRYAGAILYEVQGKDEMAAHMKWYYNVSSRLMQCQAVLTNVKHDSV